MSLFLGSINSSHQDGFNAMYLWDQFNRLLYVYEGFMFAYGDLQKEKKTGRSFLR